MSALQRSVIEVKPRSTEGTALLHVVGPHKLTCMALNLSLHSCTAHSSLGALKSPRKLEGLFLQG